MGVEAGEAVMPEGKRREEQMFSFCVRRSCRREVSEGEAQEEDEAGFALGRLVVVVDGWKSQRLEG